MSPEQARGNKGLDGRSDIYSLRVVLFQALTGELPFKADTPMGIAVAHINEPVPSVLSRRPDLSPKVETVIRRSLDKDPANRYPAASELAQSFERIANEKDSETLIVPVGDTLIEPRVGVPTIPPPQIAAERRGGESFPDIPPPPVVQKRSTPRGVWLGAGAIGILALCILAGIAGGFALGLFPGAIPETGNPTPDPPATAEIAVSTSEPPER
jgi:serine/threonine protein kinase